MFNDGCSEKTREKYRINLEQAQKGAAKNIIEQTAYLVAMAKAEALDAMGDEQAAVKLAERYL